MDIIYFITLHLLSTILSSHAANAHLEGDHDNVSDHSHSHSEESYYDVHTHHDHRALRNSSSSSTTSFMIGSQRYANQDEFIRSGSRCGTPEPTSSETTKSAEIVAKYMSNIDGRRGQAVTVEVPTYFHVIKSSATNGDISNTVLQSQLDVLNDSYRVHGFSFRLMNTIRTVNADWYVAGFGTQAQSNMKEALRVGDATTLNVYFNSIGGGLLGYASLPPSYSNFPKEDGIVILNRSVPGGTAIPYNEGKTLVHEVGHWLGLYHTFQTTPGFFPLIGFFLSLLGLRTGCNTANDEVGDTPPQQSATAGCPERRDSCPFRGGVDPINNYMDYSTDVCLIEFTPGQAERMAAMWNEYRASN